MAKINAIGADYVNNADGFSLGGGDTLRTLTVISGDPTLTGALNLVQSGNNTFIRDSSANTVGSFVTTASAVNYLEIANSATGNDLTISALGTDTDVDIAISAKGVGNILIGNYTFDADQTVGVGQDNYVLTYDNGTGLISLEVNDGSFTVTPDTNNYVVTADGSGGGIGEANLTFDGTTLEIGTGSFTPNADADNLVLNISGENGGLSIITDNSRIGSLYFGDTNSSTVGGIIYTHVFNEMYLRVGDATKLEIKATGATAFKSYGSGTFTGTAAKWLAVDASGNIIEEDAPSSFTVSPDTNNYVVTADGAGGGIGEANLTFDGTQLLISTGDLQITSAGTADLVDITLSNAQRGFYINEGAGGNPNLQMYNGAGDRLVYFPGNATNEFLFDVQVGVNYQDGTGRTRTLTIEGERNIGGNAFAQLVFRNYDSSVTTEYDAAKIESENTEGNTSGDIRFFTKTSAGSLTEEMILHTDGQLQLTGYGGGSFTGTDTYWLALDSSGNLIEEAIPVQSFTAGTGIDTTGSTGAITVSVDVSDFMSNGANNRIVTATGTDAMNAETNLTFDGSTLTVTGDLTVTNTGNTVIRFTSDTAIIQRYYDSGGAVDAKYHDIVSQDGNLLLRSLTDALGVKYNVFKSNTDGSIDFSQYGSGTFTGTATKFLAVDASGNVIEEDTPSSGLTPTSTKTTDYTALVGDYVVVDASGGDVTITSPASPSAGDTFAVASITSPGTNDIIIEFSDKFNTVADVILYHTDDEIFTTTFIYIDATVGWYYLSDAIDDGTNWWIESNKTSGHLYTTTGTHTWFPPAWVDTVSVVCIGAGGDGGNSANGGGGGGGGGLGYYNNYSITAGDRSSGITVYVGTGGGSSTSTARSYFKNTSTVYANGGNTASGSTGASGGGYLGTGGATGGTGGNGSGGISDDSGGGAGAAGYSGNGGNGGNGDCTSGAAGSGGGAGGGSGGDGNQEGAGGGGGVNPYGSGSSGAAASCTGFGGAGGNGGSGGSNGINGGGGTGGNGGAYGGGGGGAYISGNGDGSNGCVRIVWGVATTTFPSTNVADRGNESLN